MHRRISAIHEDAHSSSSSSTDIYTNSSLVFTQTASSSIMMPQRQQQSQQQEQQQLEQQPVQSNRPAADTNTEEEADRGSRAIFDMDAFSMVSGLSEGGASTARVRMATDRAYELLRFGGISSPRHNRAMSFATISSDPGQMPTPTRASSFFGYFDQDEDGGLYDGSSSDLTSLIRSDAAVYGSTGDDSKFPFLPDNFSEFSGSIMYPSPSTAAAAEGMETRYSRSLHAPSFEDPEFTESSRRPYPFWWRSGNSHNNKKEKMLIRHPRNGNAGAATTRVRRPPGGPIDGSAGESSAMGAAATMHRRASRHYRRQSVSEAYHHNVAATSAAAAAAMVAATAPNTRSHTAPLRSNALMRFFKRITPKT